MATAFDLIENVSGGSISSVSPSSPTSIADPDDTSKDGVDQDRSPLNRAGSPVATAAKKLAASASLRISSETTPRRPVSKRGRLPSVAIVGPYGLFETWIMCALR